MPSSFFYMVLSPLTINFAEIKERVEITLVEMCGGKLNVKIVQRDGVRV